MKLRRTTLARLGGLAGLLVALAACATGDDIPQNTLDPAGPAARTIDNLFMPVLYVAGVVFVLVNVLLVAAMISGRRSRKGAAEGELPPQFHGNTKLEIGWTILPAVILGAIAIPTVVTLFDLYDEPEDAMVVEVYAQRWWWEFQYPDHPVEGGDEPVTTANELHIPAGQPVFLRMESRDIIHSFWSPRLNGKRDVVPGRTHTWTIEADEPGIYEGECTEYCGTSHANMLLNVVAHDQADWEDWIAGQQEAAEPVVEEGEEPAADDPVAQGFALFSGRGCAGCHVVEGSYDQVDDASPPAPDLTHLFSRECFAGCTHDLERAELEAWLRDPPGLKDGSLMPNLNLTEADIDQLYAYLESLE